METNFSHYPVPNKALDRVRILARMRLNTLRFAPFVLICRAESYLDQNFQGDKFVSSLPVLSTQIDGKEHKLNRNDRPYEIMQ